jgi:Fic family protein
MKKISQTDEFLRESNAIEGVYDEDSFKQAKLAWKFLAKQKVLTLGVILKTHKILMLNQNLLPDEKGYFRRVPVWVGGKEGIRWEKIELALEEWLNDVQVSLTVPNKETHIQQDHVNYEHIHPFIDGNGRTGRMFMNWERLQAGLPILVVKASERWEYYKWFK